ncbi:hypothetical protein HYU06_03570 [Candidatus Woesearchaeota archaeon]|nr:hypothetical protein [Candidatus Woesearchaeota archaeon]
MEQELEDLKNLSPDERIKRLKEIQERRKKEIEEAQGLMSLTEEEIKQREREREQLPIPQLKSDTFENLLGETDREMFRMKRFTNEKITASDDKRTTGTATAGQQLEELPLEETLRRDAPQLSADQRAAMERDQYVKELSMVPTPQLYNTIKSIQENYKTTGILTGAEREQLYSLNKAMDEKADAIRAGEYNPSEYIMKEVDAGSNIINKLMRDYER